jgi:PAS domain S-box-containing protein
MHNKIETNSEIYMKTGDLIVSKTDLAGKIIYGNKTFVDISGYSESELIGAPHSILRHQDMPKAVFKLLWDSLKTKKEVFAYVKNKTKQGSSYWVFANVTCTLCENGSVKDYHSARIPPNINGLAAIKSLYRELLTVELTQGVSASEKMLTTKIKDAGVSYNDFVLNLQK